MSPFDKVEQSLKLICDECSYVNTDRCSNRKCNIAFSKEVINYAKNNSVKVLADGEKLIPKEDLKYYREESIANGIAQVCKLCKECKENHSEQCIISLCRRSLENTVLKENIEYPGNVLMYIMRVSNENQPFANMIKSNYELK